MSVDNSASPAAPGTNEPSAAARHLMRTALKASLGLGATQPDGPPVLLISRLALHTQNLGKDTRASLLIDGTTGLGDPLTGGRLTLSGHARPTTSATAKPRFLARHPSAQTYADFPDFAMYEFKVTGGHYIGGFGRIVDLAPAELLSDAGPAPELTAAETDIVSHMNSDHADAVALYATELAMCAPGSWRMCGIDPDGFDLLHCSNAARIAFPSPVRTPNEARVTLIALVKQARAQQNPAAPR